jgi:hypothetical protein
MMFAHLMRSSWSSQVRKSLQVFLMSRQSLNVRALVADHVQAAEIVAVVTVVDTVVAIAAVVAS